ncbi:MAG: thioredoxin family protein [Proteobacteria bacterium]|nr:thioredoxin family protein [Pseudomonadota bacterium]
MTVRRTLLAAAFAASLAAPAFAEPELGQPAPPFTAKDDNGKTVSLSQFAGKTVVLEWTNSGCPYVGKHYNSGTMQALQKKERANGVVWLTVSSSAPDMQGYFTPKAARAWAAKEHWAGSDILLDGAGKIGREYGAKNTPHMFVIDKAGKIAYMGGIDDQPYEDPDSLKGAKPYVAMALADLKAGRPVATPVSRPYGCSVKYNSAE